MPSSRKPTLLPIYILLSLTISCSSYPTATKTAHPITRSLTYPSATFDGPCGVSTGCRGGEGNEYNASTRRRRCLMASEEGDQGGGDFWGKQRDIIEKDTDGDKRERADSLKFTTISVAIVGESFY